MVVAAAVSVSESEPLSLRDLQQLPLPVRSDRVLEAGRADVTATLSALHRAEGGEVLRIVDERRLAWAVAYNVDAGSERDPAREREGPKGYCDRWPGGTSWRTVWHMLVSDSNRRHPAQSSTLLAELAASVACEHRDDWQDPASRPIDTGLANRAFEWVYHLNRRKVVGDVYRSFGARAGAPESIAEEAWARVFCDYWSASARRRFLGLARISTLVCQVARHVAVDSLRSGEQAGSAEGAELDAQFPRRIPRGEDMGLEVDPDSQILADQLISLVRDCLKRVPPKARLVAELIWFRDVQAKQVAGILGISEPAVSQHLKRARQTIQEALAPSLKSDQPRG